MTIRPVLTSEANGRPAAIVPEGTVPSASRSPGYGADGGTDQEPRRRVDLLRVVCHLVAEVPLVVIALVELVDGWRPTSDDAIAAWEGMGRPDAASDPVG